jgi:hypothetical protein
MRPVVLMNNEHWDGERSAADLRRQRGRAPPPKATPTTPPPPQRLPTNTLCSVHVEIRDIPNLLGAAKEGGGPP